MPTAMVKDESMADGRWLMGVGWHGFFAAGKYSDGHQNQANQKKSASHDNGHHHVFS
jgi:hypothetical protein